MCITTGRIKHNTWKSHTFAVTFIVPIPFLVTEIKHYRSKALANRETIIPWFAHHSFGSLLWRCDVCHYGSAQADIAFEQPTNNPGHHKNNKAVWDRPEGIGQSHSYLCVCVCVCVCVCSYVIMNAHLKRKLRLRQDLNVDWLNASQMIILHSHWSFWAKILKHK